MDIANTANMVWSRVKTLCRERGISQAKLARDTGLSATKISRKEPHGADASEIVLLADYFGVSTDFLLFGNRENDDPLSIIRSDGDIARAILAISDVASIDIEQHNSDCHVVIKDADVLATHLYQLHKTLTSREYRRIMDLSKNSKLAKFAEKAVQEMVDQTIADIEKDGRQFREKQQPVTLDVKENAPLTWE